MRTHARALPAFMFQTVDPARRRRPAPDPYPSRPRLAKSRPSAQLPVSTRLDLDVFHTQLRDAVRRAARGSLGAPDAALSSEDAEAPAVVSRFDRLDTLASVKSEGVGDEAV